MGMKAALVVSFAAALALGGNARGEAEAAAPQGGDVEAAGSPAGEGAATGTVAPEVDSSAKDFRIGFWEIDLLAVDHEPRGTTVRLFDFRIFRLLEIGQGPDYQSFSLFEMPGLLNLFTSQRDGASRELRIVDFQALSLAMVRQTQESENAYATSFLRLPVLGAVAAFEADEEMPNVEEQTYLFLLRRNAPR